MACWISISSRIEEPEGFNKASVQLRELAYLYSLACLTSTSLLLHWQSSVTEMTEEAWVAKIQSSYHLCHSPLLFIVTKGSNKWNYKWKQSPSLPCLCPNLWLVKTSHGAGAMLVALRVKNKVDFIHGSIMNSSTCDLWNHWNNMVKS